ncbi:MAG: hypothetical protein AAF847_08755 [Bacteroidota bacterium]
MKTLSCSFLLIFLSTTFLLSQAEEIYNNATRKTTANYADVKADSLAANEFRVLLHLDYAESIIKNPFDFRKVQNGEIQQINLYYSDFPKNRTFADLTRDRISSLLDIAPALEDRTMSWNLIKQTDCRNRTEAARLFHGFEIVVSFSRILELSSIQLDSAFKDFVVEQVFSRNDWKDMLVVTDVTGSMTPYTKQLFSWMKLNTLDKRVKQFVFFNDGDTKLDTGKKIGETGGIYHIKAKSYNKVEIEANKAMFSGNGGDDPENDVEAVLKGLELCPDCAENILIADNSSSVRDLILAEQIDRPLRIVVCGAVVGGISEEYLNLARQTGGSVHLMEEDIFNLIKINEGEQIEIGGRQFKIKNNRFVRVNKI